MIVELGRARVLYAQRLVRADRSFGEYVAAAQIRIVAHVLQANTSRQTTRAADYVLQVLQLAVIV